MRQYAGARNVFLLLGALVLLVIPRAPAAVHETGPYDDADLERLIACREAALDGRNITPEFREDLRALANKMPVVPFDFKLGKLSLHQIRFTSPVGFDAYRIRVPEGTSGRLFTHTAKSPSLLIVCWYAHAMEEGDRLMTSNYMPYYEPYVNQTWPDSFDSVAQPWGRVTGGNEYVFWYCFDGKVPQDIYVSMKVPPAGKKLRGGWAGDGLHGFKSGFPRKPPSEPGRPLIAACEQGSVERVRKLVEAGTVDIDAAFSEEDLSPLGIAIANKNHALLEALLDLGADPNAYACTGQRALMVAAVRGNHKAMDILVRRGAEVNALNSRGSTALIWAAHVGKNEAVWKLLELGADWDVANRHKQKAVDYARLAENSELVALLAGLPGTHPKWNVTVACGTDASPEVTGTAEYLFGSNAVDTVKYEDTAVTVPCAGAKTITRVWSGTDGPGGGALCATQTIKVVDTVAPVLTVPPDTTVSSIDQCGPAAAGQATAEDGCDPEPAITYEDVDNPIFTEALFAYWKMDEDKDASLAADSSGNGRPLQARGASPGRSGRIAGAWRFARNGLQCNGAGNFGAGKGYTVSLWFSTRIDSAQDLFVSTGPVASRGVKLGITANGGLRYEHRGGKGKKGGRLIKGGSGVNEGTWHHVVAVKDGPAMSLYVDGQLVGKGRNNSKLKVSHIGLGCPATGASADAERFRGLIDEVAVWTRALSKSDVAALHAAGQSRVALDSEQSGFTRTWSATDACGNHSEGVQRIIVRSDAYQ